jgi:hypothetical protein
MKLNKSLIFRTIREVIALIHKLSFLTYTLSQRHISSCARAGASCRLFLLIKIYFSHLIGIGSIFGLSLLRKKS